MVSKFNSYKSNMSEGDAEEFDVLLAELEAMGPTGIQQANQLRTDADSIFNEGMQMCEDARGRDGIANYLNDSGSGTFGAQITGKIDQLASGIVNFVGNDPQRHHALDLLMERIT